jgi:hypothetical protein
MEPIGGDVRRELDRFGVEGAIADIVAAWPAAVGPTVARNAWPARVARDGTLHVATSSSAWAYELSQLAPKVLQSLREALAGRAPTGLRFAVGPLPEPSVDEDAAALRRVPDPGPEERELADALAAGVADDELRALVARAAAASLSVGRIDRPV